MGSHGAGLQGLLAAPSDGVAAGFEGPEKILEVDFCPQHTGGSMRAVSRENWDRILDLARCQILSKTSNESFDAYVLSESSLFVYDQKVFIKTCGTTTLLRCLPLLLECARAVGEQLEWLCYSRKNYLFPEVQEFPHGSFADEIKYARQCSGPHGEPLKGGAYVLGDLTGDHWYVFCADFGGQAVDNEERNLNVMMYGLDPDVCKQFYRRNDLSIREDALRVTDQTGIRKLCEPDTVIDDWMFEPCGYSMNGLRGSTFYTVHVTPEEAFSYASFETNLETADYTSLLQKVLSVFRPKRFVVTLFADETALVKIRQCPTKLHSHRLGEEGSAFRRESQSTTSFRDEYACRMAVYDSVLPCSCCCKDSSGIVDCPQRGGEPCVHSSAAGLAERLDTNKSPTPSVASSEASYTPGTDDSD